jgi:hypothetical protein
VGAGVGVAVGAGVAVAAGAAVAPGVAGATVGVAAVDEQAPTTITAAVRIPIKRNRDGLTGTPPVLLDSHATLVHPVDAHAGLERAA